jgi:hypothetical protein
MGMQVAAPWSVNQVDSLNQYQHSGQGHPFTCAAGHVLVADGGGWHCPACALAGQPWVQNWCWDWMADGSWRTMFAPLLSSEGG